MGTPMMLKTALVFSAVAAVVVMASASVMTQEDLDKMNYTVTKDHFLPGEFMTANSEAANHTGLGTGPSNCPQGDIDCEHSGGPGSYCKYWQTPSVCQGSDYPCTCHPHNKCDAFCMWKVGASSYCKYWQKGTGGSVCQYSNIKCEC